MKEIQLTQGKMALVDDDIFEELSQYKWYAWKSYNTFYVSRNSSRINGKQHMIHMHHEIIGRPPKGFIGDHKDGNGLNNQRENLRHVTKRQNQQNRKNGKKKISQYPGVHWHKQNKKWMAKIEISGKRKHLGCFADEFQAFEAYRQAVENLGQTVINTAIQQRSISC